MQVLQQIEWHGIARKGAGRKDPMTSLLELNTQPGRETLQKVPARKCHNNSRLAAPAALFNGVGSHYIREPDNPYHGGVGQSVRACVCFKHDDYDLLDTGQNPWLYGVADGTAGMYKQWGFQLNYSGGNWGVQFQLRNDLNNFDTLAGTAALTNGVWYWAEMACDSASASMTVYADGTGTVVDSTVLVPFGGSTAGSFWDYGFVGGNQDPESCFFGGAIAYACNDATSIPTAWSAQLSLTGHDAFYLHQPRQTVHPAQAGTAAAWYAQPAPCLGTATTATHFGGDGIRSGVGQQYLWDAEGINLFDERTVFMFKTKCDARTDLLRSENSIFRITHIATAVEIFWGPADPGQGDANRGLNKAAVSSGGAVAYGAENWLAVEVNPTNQSATNTINILQYTTAGGWASILNGTSVGHGFQAPVGDLWGLLRSTQGNADLYDFRVIVGDDGWGTAHTADALATIPIGLASWLNNDTTKHPNAGFVDKLRTAHTGDVTNWTTTAADRVDGKYRFKLDPFRSRVARTGCPYLNTGPTVQVEDLIADHENTVSFSTDSYYHDGTKYRGVLTSKSANKNTIGYSGSHRYIVNNAPLQLVRDLPRQIGIPLQIVESGYASATAATYDFEGQLDWAATYQYMITLYDPITNDESAPHGPFRFETRSAPASVAVPFGTGGCAFRVEAALHANRYAPEMKMNFYRFNSADATYYHETTAPLTGFAWNATVKDWQLTGWTRFAIEPDLLTLNATLNLNNAAPPEHDVSMIWNSRGFYVDSEKPSRLYFSREFRVGTVPRSNLIWTDEGVGGEILGFMPSSEGLLLLRARSIWIIPAFATDADAWAYPLHADIGVVSGDAAIMAAGLLWWAAPTGLHSWDGKSEPINHSQRLEHQDLKVWDHAPRRTVAYEDTDQYKVVFTCEGTGIAIDTRSGAVAMVSAPEACYMDYQSTAYSGPLYGGRSGLFRRAEGNASLSLSSAGTAAGNAQQMTATADLSALYYDWALDGRSAQAMVGVFSTAGSFSTAAEWLTSTSDVGRTISTVASDHSDFWTCFASDAIQGANAMVVNCEQPLLSHLCIDSIPFHYKSQYLYHGRSRTDHTFERLDFYTNAEAGTADGSLDVTFTSWASGEPTAMITSATAAAVPENELHELKIRTRGNRYQFELTDRGIVGLPNIMELGVHIRDRRERGKP